MVDARLRDGSRVNVVLPPLALQGPVITIRKFSRTRLDMKELVARGALNDAMEQLLQVAVRARKNIVVCGGTGSGKTTLLNAIAALIPAGERIVTVEDAAELALHHEHVVALEARPRNLEGQGEVTIRDLVRNALRMRPDRIIVGECRGGEALDMLQAMNTGHEGSLTTAHANSPRDLLARLEIMSLMAGIDLPLAAIRSQIAGAIDLIVHQTRYPCGTRRISSIVEVTGIDSGIVQTQELFRFERTGPAGGEFRHCGQVPSFYESLSEGGR
jgi:pilus assembly protein CpaF